MHDERWLLVSSFKVNLSANLIPFGSIPLIRKVNASKRHVFKLLLPRFGLNVNVKERADKTKCVQRDES